MLDAPPDYKPWYFKLDPDSKAPIPGVSWKAPSSRLTIEQAEKWMAQGGNIGIAGMPSDYLVNVDLDGEHVDKAALKPTLMTRSRSRTGIHGFYFTWDKANIPNIPTDEDGEVRSQAQYVVCAGSYVPTDPTTVSEAERENAGYYTVEEARPPAWITFNDLPQVFRDQYAKNRRGEEEAKGREATEYIRSAGRHSALFDITALDVVRREGGQTKPSKRWGAIFHDSTTEANMSFSSRGLLQCWRHGVTHNGLTALVVLSGYMTCEEAGAPHKGSGASPSKVRGDDGAIFHAWLYAKTHGYIPEDDPIPVRAMSYIAEKHLGYKNKRGELLPHDIYIQVLEIVEDKY